MSVEVVGLLELFDEGAAAPGGGARRARRLRGRGRGPRPQRRQAGVRPAAPLPAARQRGLALVALPQVGVGPVGLPLAPGQQPPGVGRAVQVRVRRRRAFVTFHFRRLATAGALRSLAPLEDRQFSIVIVRYVSSGCVILYFTER